MTGLDGSPPVTVTKTDVVSIVVAPSAAPVARIATMPASVPQNWPVTLDGSESTGAATYQWSHLRTAVDPPIDLSAGTNGPKLTFTFPKTQNELTFELKVCNAAATPLCSTASVTIGGAVDVLAVARARYRNGRWPIAGTVTSTLQNSVTVHAGPTLGGAKIGTVNVDPTGAWQLDDRSGLPGATSISVDYARGGVLLGQPVTR